VKKQFVWIMTDSTRFDMLGCYGNPDMKTPCIDALAGEGVRFNRAFSAQPVCGPARSLLFTGIYPHENGSWGNCMPLGADVKTLGQRLQEKGIKTAYIGKWHLDGGDYFGNGVCPDGWDQDYWYDMKCYLDELDSDGDRMRSRKAATCFENGGIDAGYTYGHRCAEKALDYIEKHSEDNFFLTVSFDEPHGPSLCPEPYASMYQDYEWPDSPAYHDPLENKPSYQAYWGKTVKAGKGRKVPLYLGCNSFIDSEIGRIVDKVHELLPDAVILFTSDHGEALGAHGLNHKGPAVYDEITRVPLIISGPGFQRGTVAERTVSHADLPATVMDCMGLKIPKIFSGRSLAGMLKDGEDETDGRAFVEFNRYERDHDGFGGLQLMRGLVTDHYRLAVHLTDTDEMYDTDRDPYCVKNVIDDPEYAAKRDEMHDRILQWMNETRDPFRGYQWKCRPWRKEYAPDWNVDGWTRQYDSEDGEYRQKDYDTGLEMKEASRIKNNKKEK